MSSLYPILHRELKSYFASPLAYIIIVVFQAITAGFFFLQLKKFLQIQLVPGFHLHMEDLNLNNLIIAPYFFTITLLLIFVIPLITMRQIADERKSYTSELLFTSPIKIYTIVVGKYIAALILLTIMLLLSSINVFVLTVHGNPDIGTIISGYVGLFLLGASFLAIGIFTSSLTENQLIAALICFGLLLVLWLIGTLSPSEGNLLGYISAFNHFEPFSKGIIRLKDIVYYLTLIYLGLFLSYTALESERWR